MSKQIVLGAFAATLALGVAGAAPAQQAEKPRPKVEVVFCLDTTGSMGGLINAAKQKIWSISNQIAAGQPTPDLRVGLVAYRDRRDAYVTQVFDLTDDLDAVYTNLMKFEAGGGGDGPESVNQALHEAVTKVKWGEAKDTLRIVFLVGDAPPHMDYPDDVKYPETCQTAAKQGIIINTVLCGGNAQAKDYWEKICHLAEGSFVQIDQTGGSVAVVKTPFDEKLGEINRELARSTLAFGSAPAQEMAEKQKDALGRLEGAKAADRAGFYANARRAATYDLLEQINRGNVKLDELKKEELPPELRELNREEQQAYLEKLNKQREELNRQAVELDQKRKEFIAQKQREDAKGREADSFDGQVLTILQRQAERINVEYAAPAPAAKDEE